MVSTALQDSFDRSFGLYRDLLDSLDEPLLAARLPGVRSNAIGAQLWCVIGARESYGRAIVASRWVGFSCSLEDPRDMTLVSAALASAEVAVAEAIRSLGEPSDAQERLLLDLLAHEAQHHGQLIRYLYGLDLPIPASWKARYALD